MRFEQALWQEIQEASADRIALYEKCVSAVSRQLREAYAAEVLLEVEQWPLVKSAYIVLINLRDDDELAETWFNSIFCGLFSHDQINDGCMFIHTTRPALRVNARTPQTRLYEPKGDVEQALRQIFEDFSFEVGYENLERDLSRLFKTIAAKPAGLGVQGP